jgi:hypothetical protein
VGVKFYGGGLKSEIVKLGFAGFAERALLIN